MDELFVCTETKYSVLCSSKNKELIEFTEGDYDEQSSFWLCDKPVTVDYLDEVIKRKGDIEFIDKKLAIVGCKQIEFFESNTISKNDVEY